MRKQASKRIGMLFIMQPPRCKAIMADFTGLRDVTTGGSLALAVLEFFVPGHLDGFELGFVGSGGAAGRTRGRGGRLLHCREADSEGVRCRIVFVMAGSG